MSGDRNGADDELTIDEPLASGALNKVVSGERAAGERLLRSGRAQLARMKTLHGVNARVAAGEPGGFFRSLRVLPDGTRIEALTNDGIDSVRITVPPVPAPASSAFEGQGSATSYEATALDSHYEPDWPGKQPVEPAPPRLDFTPYLWIGVRIVTAGAAPAPSNTKRPQKWAQRLHVCVWEPGPPGRPPVILSNRNQFESLVPEVLESLESEEVYPLKYWTEHIPSDFEQDPELPLNVALPTAVAYTDDKLVMILPHNVYDIPMRVPNYDPARDEDVEWDVMFISDPDNDLQLADTLDPTLKMEGGYSGGEYLVKVMAVAGDCFHYAPCEVEIKIFIGKDGEEIVDKERFTIAHYTNYRMGIMPLGWFKPPEARPDHSCLECYYRAQDFGANPHGPHWWQGMAVAGVPHLQVAVPESEFLPPSISFSRPGEIDLPKTGFEPAAFHSRADICPGCITTSVRYYAISLGVRQYAEFTEPNNACAIHFPSPPAIMYPAPEPTYVISQRIGDLGGGDTSYHVPESHFGLHNISSMQWETEAGHSGSMPVAILPLPHPDPVPEVKEYRWMANTGEGAYCLTGIFFAGTPTAEREMRLADGAAWYAYLDRKFGGPAYDDRAHSCYTITTVSDEVGNVLSDTLDFISLAAYLAAPYITLLGPGRDNGVLGTDVCARVERMEWSALDPDNMPPNQ